MGDDPRLVTGHARHNQIAWIDCYDPGCTIHAASKAKNRFQIKRIRHIIETPYERKDLEHYKPRYWVKGTNVMILKRTTPSNPEFCNLLAVTKACPFEECPKHGPIKAQLWHEQQEAQGRCKAAYAVNCEDDRCTLHGNAKFDIRNSIATMKEDGFNFKTRKGSKNSEKEYDLLLTNAQINCGECRAMTGPLCRKVQCPQHPNEGLFKSKN
jgi:hypothetical protein